MPLRLIHIGLGGWGQQWGEALQRSNQVELVGCVDPSPAALAQAQAKLGVPAAHCFPSLEAAFAATESDAVLITAALAAHVPLALAALAAGKHVLVEKPFAPTLTEARQVVAAAAQRERVLMVSQNYRFFPAVRAVAALLRNETLGPIGSVSVDFRRYANTVQEQGHRHYAYRQPLLLDMAVHHFDLMRMLLGTEAVQVSCRAWNPPWSRFAEPAAAAATIDFEGGTVVSYRGSWVSPGPETAWAGEWRIECAAGEITWTGRNGSGAQGDTAMVRLLGQRARPLELPALPSVDIDASLASFVHAIRAGHADENAGANNLGSLALTLAAIESAHSGVPVALQPE